MKLYITTVIYFSGVHGLLNYPKYSVIYFLLFVAGEHNEFTLHYTPIDDKNLANRAELLLDQYGRTGNNKKILRKINCI